MEDRTGPAPVITVLNLKGGVGKTHCSWLLASVAQERGRRILLIDLDTQANLTRSFLETVDPKTSVAELFNPASDGTAAALIHRTAFSHIDIIPASTHLVPFDVSDQRVWEATDQHFTLVDPINAVRNQYDLIVIDCPPRLSLVSFAALCASDSVIVPLEAADWGAQGITHVAQAAEYVKTHYNPSLRLLGYLVSRFKPTRVYQQAYLKQLRDRFGEETFDTTIPDNALFERSVTDRQPITLTAPRSRSAHIARAFFDEVERRILGGAQGRRKRGKADARRAAVAGSHA
jgi:chromosome partitioning protein